MKKSMTMAMVSTCFLLNISVSFAEKVTLTCEKGIGGAETTSFVLYSQAPGTTVFIPILENTVCNFSDVVISDTGITYFYVAAKNSVGITKRNWVKIAVQPSLKPLPVPPVPTTSGIQ